MNCYKMSTGYLWVLGLPMVFTFSAFFSLLYIFCIFHIFYNKHILTSVQKKFKLLFKISFNKYHLVLLTETHNKCLLFLFQTDRDPILILGFYLLLTKNISPVHPYNTEKLLSEGERDLSSNSQKHNLQLRFFEQLF